jgi:hypothetical protein
MRLSQRRPFARAHEIDFYEAGVRLAGFFLFLDILVTSIARQLVRG